MGSISERYNWKDKVVLVAEDDDSSYYYLETLLKKASAKVLRARDGQQTINIVNKTPNVDLILMDIKMPVVNGLEATVKIKETNPQIKVIAQTAYTMPGDSELALGAGCDDYIAKPIRKDKILKIIDKYLQ